LREDVLLDCAYDGLGSCLDDLKICGVLTNPSLLWSHMIADAVVSFFDTVPTLSHYDSYSRSGK